MGSEDKRVGLALCGPRIQIAGPAHGVLMEVPEVQRQKQKFKHVLSQYILEFNVEKDKGPNYDITYTISHAI